MRGLLVIVLAACTGKVPTTTEDSGGDEVCAALLDPTTTSGLVSSEPYVACPSGGSDDLVAKAAVREPDGGPYCTICTTSAVTGELAIENPCSFDLVYEGCGLAGYELLGPDGIGVNATIACVTDTGTPPTIVPAGDRVTFGVPFADLVEGVYTLSFEPDGFEEVATRFCVDLP